VPCEGGESLLGSDEVNSPLVPGRQFDAVSSLIVAATLSSVENDLQVCIKNGSGSFRYTSLLYPSSRFN
jgi:hypothetical protein